MTSSSLTVVKPDLVPDEDRIPALPVDRQVCAYVGPSPSGLSECRFRFTVGDFVAWGMVPASPNPWNIDALGFVYFHGPWLDGYGRLAVKLSAKGGMVEVEIDRICGITDVSSSHSDDSVVVRDASHLRLRLHAELVPQAAHRCHVLDQPFCGAVELYWD